METVAVHSKAFVIKWISVPDNYSIRWQLKPNKKSINFGIFRKVPDRVDHLGLPSSSRLRSASVATLAPPHTPDSTSSSTVSTTQSLDDRLRHSGLQPVYWHGKCHANSVLKGSYTIAAGSGGMFAFVFDNTFSKTLSKTVQFAHTIQPVKDLDSVPGISTTITHRPENKRRKSAASNPPAVNERYCDGVLLKKRRKKLQGYAKRYFTLDGDTGMLSYYRDVGSSLLRGSIPLAYAAVSIKPSTREIFIDSGAEIWNLRATAVQEFEKWISALERARKPTETAVPPLPVFHNHTRVETIGSKLNEALFLVRKLGDRTPGDEHSAGYFGLESIGDLSLDASSRRNPFRRKKSVTTSTPTPDLPRAQLETIERLLEEITLEYSLLANASKRQSLPLDGASIHSEPEYFDAEEALGIIVLADDDVEDEIVIVSDEDEDDESEDVGFRLSSLSSSSSLVSPPVRNLYPLPLEPVTRRTTIPPNAVQPPSLIQFVRKNVGKDLSTVAMPVTANEPLSLLQRCAESFEYSTLLDEAAKASVDSGEQIMYIAAFAVSCLSNMRSRERALRKPFNPLLNETYELVREDRGFRFLAEKISHRPPIMATYAESSSWTYSYCPQPAQKFWGKSAEIVSEGPITISIAGQTTYSYVMPTTYLRNMLAGEKYIEPSGQVAIVASSGHRAVVEFKAKSMFSGQRSEEVVVRIFAPQSNAPMELGLSGTWTKELVRTDGKTVWSVGKLLPDKSRYGFPEFCAALNELTAAEAGLATTDSRLRPDQRCLEDGEVEKAEELKNKLEEMQREKRRQGKIPETGVSSVWFNKVEDGVWVPVVGEHGYWECRQRQDWSACPHLW